jgi:hypothetical protein
MDWRRDSSGSVQSPNFKPQYYKKKKVYLKEKQWGTKNVTYWKDGFVLKGTSFV